MGNLQIIFVLDYDVIIIPMQRSLFYILRLVSQIRRLEVLNLFTVLFLKNLAARFNLEMLGLITFLCLMIDLLVITELSDEFIHLELLILIHLSLYLLLSSIGIICKLLVFCRFFWLKHLFASDIFIIKF